MGIASILAKAMRGVAWGQVANMALQYGPEILKKIKERRHPQQPQAEDDGNSMADQLQERIEELETALLTQQKVIEQQTQTINQLEEAAGTLQAKLNVYMAIAAGLILLSVVLLVLVLRQ